MQIGINVHYAYGMRLGRIMTEGRSEEVLQADNLKQLFLC